ncbi:uncharacterized protein LOC131150357 [Malania oleifera]|uniref:uncharacterized protein LOC131150357 n=1 Tax=Malania oleifera TaxID=397392 RepID=UPI0025ADEC7A|nr:uncharacterized protein LOC131150357 [Malania oleifera]XP_057957032.1 uncharacterized protein LOC131150357 [Malania oleifera]
MSEPAGGTSLESRPGIFLIGSPNVGKRTLLSRLLSFDFVDASDSSTEVLVHGWTINTKYYTADVSVWMAHLHDEFSITSLPIFNRLAALVMVFDMSDPPSLVALQDWVSRTDIQKFDILLCIGNKVDLVPGHSAHVEYRRRLQRLADSSEDSHSEFTAYGLSETEGSSLLGDEEPSWEIRRSCFEWCTEHNIEYIEACASNADFDNCLSVDGDSQGVERLYGAISAHMWPGMILKSGNKIIEPSFPGKQDLSEEESDYEIEYEVLSDGSAEPWDGTDEEWVSADGPVATAVLGSADIQTTDMKGCDQGKGIKYDGENLQPSTSGAPLQERMEIEMVPKEDGFSEAAERSEDGPKEYGSIDRDLEPDEGTLFEFEDLEQLMSEIGNVRDSLRLMPDFQRREMAAKLAMKMALMFGDSSGDEEGFD